jgi:hypothetical protein
LFRGFHWFVVYDAENRLIAISGTSYVYDGEGNRVKKCTAGTTAGTCTSNGTGMLYWKSLDGGTLAESDLGGSWTAVYGLIRGKIYSRVDGPKHTQSNAIVRNGSSRC